MELTAKKEIDKLMEVCGARGIKVIRESELEKGILYSRKFKILFVGNHVSSEEFELAIKHFYD